MYRFIVADMRSWVQQGLSDLILHIYPSATVRTVPTASALLADYARYGADLILMCYNLPCVEAQRVLVTLRNAGNPVPVAVFAADPSDITAALRWGATSALDNPFDAANLRGLLGNMLSPYAAEQMLG